MAWNIQYAILHDSCLSLELEYIANAWIIGWDSWQDAGLMLDLTRTYANMPPSGYSLDIQYPQGRNKIFTFIGELKAQIVAPGGTE